MPSELTLSRDGVTVTVYGLEIDDAFANKLFLITVPQSNANQSLGPVNPKIVDLLRIQRTILITGSITGNSTDTAEQVKAKLIDMATISQTTDSLVTLTYDGIGKDLTSGSTTQIEGIIEKIAFNEKPKDEPSTQPEDMVKYEVQITFIWGIRTS